MIEKQIPLEIPPGMVKNGTLQDRAGRWIDGNLIRFPNGVPRAWGNWTAIITNAAPPTTSVPQSAFAWFSPSHLTVYVACATGNRVYVVQRSISGSTHTLTNITPASGAAPSVVSGVSFTNYGRKLLYVSTGQGTNTVYLWDPSVGGPAAALSSQLAGAHGVFVTPENFVMALTFEASNIKWADQDDITVWTPTALNSAGGLTLPSASVPIVGHQVRGQTLVWTYEDLWVLNYLGEPLYYGAALAGSKCGAIGANVVSVVDGVARWMGSNGFFMYDGYTRPIPCPVSEYVFGSINHTYGHRFFQVSIPEQNEIIWFYCSDDRAGPPDRYVSYNYDNDTWATGTLDRAAGVSGWPTTITGSNAPVAAAPLLFDMDGINIWQHEVAATSAAGAYIESGPINFDHDHMHLVQKLIPDGAALGDDITLYAGGFPGAAETDATNAIAAIGSPIDVRLSGRYARYKQTLDSYASRVGIPRLGVIQQGKR